MSWTYAAVKAADAALDPPIADPAAAAAAINTQTSLLTEPQSAVSVATIHGILLLSTTGDWLRIEGLSTAAYSANYPATPSDTDRAINAAKLAVTLSNSKVAAISPASWSNFLSLLLGLVTATVVSPASYSAISALGVMTVPAWQPPLTAGDVQTARGQP